MMTLRPLPVIFRPQSSQLGTDNPSFRLVRYVWVDKRGVVYSVVSLG